jgi:predicted RNase H-like nuclease (RuvC/YqgF family)
MHIFPYSRRPGTPADAMPDQITHAVKARRAHEAQQVAERMHRAYLEENVGQVLPVLFETTEEGSVGHSDSYVLVKVPNEGLQGQQLNEQPQEQNEELKNKCEQYADEYKTMAHQREQLYSQLSEARIAGEELNSKYETLKRKLEHSRDLEYLDRIFHGTGA